MNEDQKINPIHKKHKKHIITFKRKSKLMALEILKKITGVGDFDH
jgi:hypothetical protein